MADVQIGHGGIVTLSVTGVDPLEALVAAVPDRANRLLSAALWEEANSILNESLGLVPVRRGILRASADIALPKITRTSVEVEFGYGGAASDYDVVQHEATDYRHAPGRGPKFLERPALAAAANLDRRLAARLSALFRGPLGGIR